MIPFDLKLGLDCSRYGLKLSKVWGSCLEMGLVTFQLGTDYVSFERSRCCLLPQDLESKSQGQKMILCVHHSLLNG